MKFETLLFEQDGHVGMLTINRPQALNALNEQVLDELRSFTKQLTQQPGLRVLIITGSGEKAFVAGADIKAMQGMTPAQATGFSGTAQSVFDSIESLPFAVIAAVNGFALGGGFELALSADIILASDKAKFGLPEVTLGLLPSFGGTQRLPRAVGLYKAREMVFSGEFYSAESLRTLGLVSRVVSSAELMAEAKKLAQTIASRGPVAINKAKKAMIRGLDLSLDKGLEQEAQLFGELFDTEDHKEGLSAFIEKRTPGFQGS